MAQDTFPSEATTGAPTGHPQRWFILGILCLCLVLIVASVSSLNVAIPAIQSALTATQSDLQWILDAYALVFAGLLLPAGALGDRFGRKKTLVFGLVIFAAASVYASYADTPNQLIGARAIMGIGAAFIMPSTLSLLISVFPPHERPKAIAAWAGFAGAGGAIGVLASGVLLKFFWWGSVFFVVVPLIVAALAFIIPIVPDSKESEEKPLDPLGSVLSTLGFFSLVYAIIEGPVKGWTHGLVVGGFAAAVVLLVGFVLYELRVRHPMLDPRYFRIPRFSMGSLTITVMFFAMFSMFFIGSQWMQFVKGYTPLAAGIATMPFAMIMIIVAPRGPKIAARITPRLTIAVGMGFTVLGAIVFFTVGSDSPYIHFGAALACMAIGAGLSNPAATTSIMTSLPMDKAGVGSAVNDTTREVGGAVGIAAIGSIAASVYRHQLDPKIAELPEPAREAARDYIGAAIKVVDPSKINDVHDAFTRGMNIAMLATGAVSLLGLLAVLRWYPKHTELEKTVGH